MILIAIAPDVSVLENIRSLLSATGASKVIAEVQTIVVPKNYAQTVVFAEQIKPLAPFLKDISKMSAMLFEIESNKSPQP